MKKSENYARAFTNIFLMHQDDLSDDRYDEVIEDLEYLYHHMTEEEAASLNGLSGDLYVLRDHPSAYANPYYKEACSKQGFHNALIASDITKAFEHARFAKDFSRNERKDALLSLWQKEVPVNLYKYFSKL